jgi:uncharacterized integral membrane protein
MFDLIVYFSGVFILLIICGFISVNYRTNELYIYIAASFFWPVIFGVVIAAALISIPFLIGKAISFTLNQIKDEL